ncbi:MAG: hypothetical protein WDN47_04300 [Candidatus Doudnabacteria bacterium]
MEKWSSALVVALLMIAPPVSAQQDEEKKVDHPEGVTIGFKMKGGLQPVLWAKNVFGNFPENLTTFVFVQGGSFKDDGVNFTLRPTYQVPLQFGPTLNFGNRIQIAAGPAFSFRSGTSDIYCEGGGECGSFYDYFELSTAAANIGVFAEASVKVAGPIWFTTEVSSYGLWRDINFSQGRHALDDLKPSLPEQTIGSYRVPLIALAGFRFCGDCDKDSRAGYGFLAGFSYGETRMEPGYTNIQYSQKQKVFIFEFFLEENIFNWAGRKSGS